jgi:hypothetical protein
VAIGAGPRADFRYDRFESQAVTNAMANGRSAGSVASVIDEPFAATRELAAAFLIWEVKDMDEAVAWVKRSPNPMPGPSEIEIRPTC